MAVSHHNRDNHSKATIQSAKEANCRTVKAITHQNLNNNEWQAKNQR